MASVSFASQISPGILYLCRVSTSTPARHWPVPNGFALCPSWLHSNIWILPAESSSHHRLESLSTALHPRRTEAQSPETLPHPHRSVKTKGSRAPHYTLPGKQTGSRSEQWLTKQWLCQNGRRLKWQVWFPGRSQCFTWDILAWCFLSNYHRTFGPQTLHCR